MEKPPDWRSENYAKAFETYDRADFAQEFLNRNRDYRQDHAATQARIAEHPSKQREEQEGLAGRWGLCFPHRSRGQRSQIACTLVARDCARCRDPRRFGLGWCDPASAGL